MSCDVNSLYDPWLTWGNGVACHCRIRHPAKNIGRDSVVADVTRRPEFTPVQRSADELPIVTFTSHEAYLLYAYAPSLRNRLFVADLHENHTSRLFRGMLLEYEFENKWLTVYPDLPKLVNLDQLRHMGKFHLLNSDSWVLAEQENRPLKSFPLQKIAQALSFEKVGDLYEVRPN
jgi:hypothetical protein